MKCYRILLLSSYIVQKCLILKFRISIISNFPLPVLCVPHVEWYALLYAFAFKNNGSFSLSEYVLYIREN